MKLTIRSTLVTAIAMAAIAAAGCAATAHADPPLLNGTYTSDGDADGFLWTISSRCAGNDCTADVASSQGWTSRATLTHGRWNFTVTKPDGVICEDGRYAPASVSMSVDPVTLNGTISSDSNYGCPGGNLSEAPFKLRKVG